MKMLGNILVAILFLFSASVANAQCFPREYAKTRLGLLTLKEVEAFNHYEKGKDFMSVEEYESVTREFNSALKLDRRGEGIAKAYGCNVLLRDLAQAYRNSKDYDNALKIYKLHLEVAPNNWKVMADVGRVLTEKGEYEKAIDFLKDKIARGAKILRSELVKVYIDYQVSVYDFEGDVIEKGKKDNTDISILEKAWEEFNRDISDNEYNIFNYLDDSSVNLGYYLEIFGKIDWANEFYSNALMISKEKFPENITQIRNLQRKLEEIKERGKY